MSARANRRLTDPRELVALAHPVRVRILEQLTIHGPLTATALGDLLDESPANCSWHLRKLAEHGFVEEAEGPGGRRRPWRVTSVGFDLEAEDLEPRDRPGARALNRMMLERWLDRFHASLAQAEHEEPGWRAARGLTQTATWVTSDELDEVMTEVGEVLRRYRERLTDPSTRPPGSRLCEFVAWGAPIDVGQGR